MGGISLKKKIIGVLVCMLLIITSFISVSGIKNETLRDDDDIKNSSTMDGGWYYLPSYYNYAPKGMPDFSQLQRNWKTIYDNQFGSYGNGIGDSIAIGDDLQITPYGEPVDWENNPSGIIIGPGPNCDLETTPGGDDWAGWTFCGSTAVANCFYWLDSRYEDPRGEPGDGDNDFNLVQDYGAGDDHAVDNVPLLIEEIAVALNNTGLWNDEEILECFGDWFKDNSLGEFFNHHFYWYPTFEFVANQIQQGKAVLVRFYLYDKIAEEVNWIDAHWVSCAGVNIEDEKIAICDPSRDSDYREDDHNDAQYVSHDIYNVELGSPHPDIESEWWLPGYPGYWIEYYVVVNALVINASDLSCNDNLKWVNVTPGSTLQGNFSVENTGDNGSMLNWFISLEPTWSNFSFEPNQGENLSAGQKQEVKVSFVAPNGKNQEYSGRFKIQNSGYNGDYCYINVSVITPKSKPIKLDQSLFKWLFEQFPKAFPVLRYIFEK